MVAATAHLVPAQHAYIQKQTEGKTEEQKVQARANDKAAHAELNGLRARPENMQCFDCDARKPGWAVLPWGVYICIDCAQVHRNLGRHISQTKAINTGTYLWFEHELPVMRAVGNAVGARAFGSEAMAAKPSRDAAPETKSAYAHAKYVEHKWGAPQFDAACVVPQRATTRTPAKVAPPAATAQPAPPPKPTAAAPMMPLIPRAAPAAPAANAKPAGPPPDLFGDLFGDDVAAPAPSAPQPPRDARAELIAMFDPLALPQPKKAAAMPGDDFFAHYGLI